MEQHPVNQLPIVQEHRRTTPLQGITQNDEGPWDVPNLINLNLISAALVQQMQTKQNRAADQRPIIHRHETKQNRADQRPIIHRNDRIIHNRVVTEARHRSGRLSEIVVVTRCTPDPRRNPQHRHDQLTVEEKGQQRGVWHVPNHRTMPWGFHGVHLRRIETSHRGYREEIDPCDPKERQDCNRPNGHPMIKVIIETIAAGSTARGSLPPFLEPRKLNEIWNKATWNAALPTIHLQY